MDPNEILQRLSTIGTREGSWLLIANLISELETLPPPPDGPSWRDRAIAASGHGTSSLQHMLKAKRFLDSLADDLPEPFLTGLRRWRLAHVEMLSRMAQLDRAKALEICQSEEMPTLQQIRDEYDELRRDPDANLSRLAKIQRASKILDEAAIRAIRSAFSGVQIAKWPDGFLYASPQALVSTFGGTIEAVCWPRSISDKDKFRKFIQETLAEHSFFDRYWWALSHETLPFFARERARLGLSNIGIVVFDQAAETAYIHAKPTHGPIPDRTELTRAFLRRFRIRGAEGQSRSLAEESPTPRGP